MNLNNAVEKVILNGSPEGKTTFLMK